MVNQAWALENCVRPPDSFSIISYNNAKNNEYMHSLLIYALISISKTWSIFASLPVFWGIVGNEMTSGPGQSQTTFFFYFCYFLSQSFSSNAQLAFHLSNRALFSLKVGRIQDSYDNHRLRLGSAQMRLCKQGKRENIKRRNRYILSSKHTYRLMRASVVAQLFYKT